MRRPLTNLLLRLCRPWMFAVYCWLLNSYVQEKAKGLLVAEDGSVPVPVPVADTP